MQIMNGVQYEQRVTALPDEVELGALSVAPNPAAAATASVRLTLPTAQAVSAEVVDALGRAVATVPTQAVMAPGSPALDSDCYTAVTMPGQSLAVASPRDNTYYAFLPRHTTRRRPDA